MKFDSDQVIKLAEALATERWPGTVAETSATNMVAEALERAGARVAIDTATGPVETSPPSPALGVGAMVAGACLVLLTWLVGSEYGPDPLRMAIGFGGMALLGLVDRRLRTGRWGRTMTPLRLVRGRLGPTEGAAVRVVLLTQLGSRKSRWAERLTAILNVAEWLWLAALILPVFVVGAWTWIGFGWPFLMIALGGLATLRHETFRSAPGEADNRTGLALLAGLAGGWPETAKRTIEAHFVAATAGWARWEWPGGPRAPTLLILLDAPGVGPEVLVAGPDREVALGVGRDLWLPIRSGRRRPRNPGQSGRLPADVRIVLSGVPGSSGLNANCLSATAQLVIELALRWGRRAATAPSAARPPD